MSGCSDTACGRGPVPGAGCDQGWGAALPPLPQPGALHHRGDGGADLHQANTRRAGFLQDRYVVVQVCCGADTGWCREAGGAEGEVQTVRAGAAPAPATTVRGRSQ